MQDSSAAGSDVRRDLPRLARVLASAWRSVALAWLLMLLGGAIGASLAAREPATLYALLPVGFGYPAERIDRLWSSQEARDRFLAREETPTGRNVLFGSHLFAHNTRVGLLSFATGMLGGVPTILLQLYNGMMVGAFTVVFLHESFSLPFVAWILPHGIPEFTAITLCCAAGLVLGAAVAAPGRRSRVVALREASVPALALVACSVPLFLVAALAESFVRESTLGTGVRLSVAAGFALLLLFAHGWLWWQARRRAVDTSWLFETAREVGGEAILLRPRRSAGPDSGSGPEP